MWIEDESGHPVRTIALWFNKLNFLHELSTWYGDELLYRTDGARDLVRSISSATRPAGQYTLDWNGIDDAGKPAGAGKAGQSISFIEVAREHGTRQLLEKYMDFTRSAQEDGFAGRY